MSDALSPQSPLPAPSHRVVDVPVRMAHALLATGFLGAWLTSGVRGLQPVHLAFGYTAAAALVFRLLWALLNPRSASLSTWWRAAGGWPRWWRAARQGQVRFAALSTIALASTVIAMLLGVALSTGSGALMHQLGEHHAWGEVLEELHEALGNALLLAVLMHLALVGVLSVMRGRNMASTMLTGRAPGAGPDRIQRPHAIVGALLLMAVLAGWWWAAPFDSRGASVNRAGPGHGDHAAGGREEGGVSDAADEGDGGDDDD